MKNQDIVWDLPTRVFHWIVAIPVLLNFFLEGGELPHKILGYVALIGLLLRLIWGFKSTSHSRLAHFPLKRSEVWDYLASIAKREPKMYVGHNPIASWVYLLIWLMVVLLGVSGFMMGLDAFWGEEWLEEIHEALSNILMGLVLLHLGGIFFDSIKFKRKTWLGMITGKKS
jgi:cytochrome b